MKKGQAAMQYLFLLGSGLIVAGISVALLVNVISSSGGEAITAVANALCAKFPERECNERTILVEGQTVACYSIDYNKCRAFDGVLWMKMDDGVQGSGQTVKDNSFSGHDGIIDGDTDCTVKGKFGGGCSFNGTNATIDLGNIGILGGQNALTVSVWIKTPVGGKPVKRGIIHQSGISDDSIKLRIHRNDANGKVLFTVFNETSSDEAETNNQYDFMGEWHHYAGVFTGSNVLIYEDGILQELDQPPLSGPIRSSAQPLIIGASEPSSDYFEGTMDEFTVWQRALSEKEIKYLASR